MKRQGAEAGFSLVELTVAMMVFLIMALSLMMLFIALVHSAIIAKRQAVGLSLAATQMEYLKSLPYDSLAVSGGSILATSYLPATTTKTLNGVTYTTTTTVTYVDDAFDGCASYPTLALKQLYCRNYPPPSGAPATDLNPADYKIIHVDVTDNTGLHLASVDTEESARVAETASTTGALFVSVIDNSGSPISGATVNVVDPSVTPSVNVNDSTDSDGNSIFYGLPPDNSARYVITATKSGYSSLSTIAASGSLVPTYPNQKILTQASSYVTLTLAKQGQYSLVMEAVDTSGNPIANLKLYIKGGYKKYTLSTDTAYYYDGMSPSDVRPVTDASGLASVQNLAPGTYVFCGDLGATSCQVGGTTYYMLAAMAYTSTSPFNPIAVPTYDPSNPPATTYSYGGNSYVQKVRLILSSSSTAPRVFTISPTVANLSAPTISSYAITINGTNLPCSNNAASCSTTVKVLQGANTYTASCKGAASGLTLSCKVNLSTASVGNTRLQVTANGTTFTTPVAPPIGGIIVSP